MKIDFIFLHSWINFHLWIAFFNLAQSKNPLENKHPTFLTKCKIMEMKSYKTVDGAKGK